MRADRVEHRTAASALLAREMQEKKMRPSASCAVVSESRLLKCSRKWFRSSVCILVRLPQARWDLRRALEVSTHTVLAWEQKLAISSWQSRDFYRCHLHQFVAVKSDVRWVPRRTVGNHWFSRRRHEQDELRRGVGQYENTEDVREVVVAEKAPR